MRLSKPQQALSQPGSQQSLFNMPRRQLGAQYSPKLNPAAVSAAIDSVHTSQSPPSLAHEGTLHTGSHLPLPTIPGTTPTARASFDEFVYTALHRPAASHVPVRLARSLFVDTPPELESQLPYRPVSSGLHFSQSPPSLHTMTTAKQKP
jgi:hypothetical protein